MEIAKHIKIIICDNVRFEVGNKLSIMGIYTGSLRIQKIKSLLPTLGIVILLDGIKADFTNVIVRYTDPKGKKFPDIVISKDVVAKEIQSHNFVAHFSPFIVEHFGTAEFKIFFINKDKILNEDRPIIEKLEISLS